MAALCSQRLSHSYLVPPTLEYTPSYDYQLVEGDSFYAGQYVEGEFLYSVVVAAEYTTLTYTKVSVIEETVLSELCPATQSYEYPAPPALVYSPVYEYEIVEGDPLGLQTPGLVMA